MGHGASCSKLGLGKNVRRCKAARSRPRHARFDLRETRNSPQIIGRAGSPLHAERAAPTGVVALPAIETPWFPSLRERGLCGFTFYLGNPFPSVPEFLIELSAVASDTDALQLLP
jgi:hypothetical protein